MYVPIWIWWTVSVLAAFYVGWRAACYSAALALKKANSEEMKVIAAVLKRKS